jgi:hypothetical protein
LFGESLDEVESPSLAAEQPECSRGEIPSEQSKATRKSRGKLDMLSVKHLFQKDGEKASDQFPAEIL